ncbi:MULTISPECIES: sensor histidine kinase [unclassified Flavobacterium]|uniref:ATP-binding protein n=1 Tax=unclassified Flavobacterium TaxID=196869 RepID=UPI0036080BE6
MKLEQALLYEEFGDYENAIKILYESREIAEAQNLKDKQVSIHWKIGNLYTTTFAFNKAKKHLYLARNIAEKVNKKDLLSKAYQGLYRLHSMIESDSAKYYLDKVAFYSKGSTDLSEHFKVNNNFFKYHFGRKEYQLAKFFSRKSLEIAESSKNKQQIAIGKINYALCLMEGDKNYQETIKIYKEVLKLYPNNEDHKNVSQCLLNISYAYEKIGDYKNALEYTNRYLDFVELILNGKVEQATQEIETRYQLDKAANEFKEKEKNILEKQKRNQKITLLLAFLLLLSGVIFYFYYQNLLLKQKNRIKDIDSNLQYNIISATLDGQDQERNKISQILHDYVSATLSSVGLHLSAFESSLTPEQRSDLRKTRSLLKQAHDKVRDLSHELIPPLLVKFGLQFALKDLCENNSNSLLTFYYKSTISEDKKFDPDFEIKIYYIVSELINNIIKHSGATEAYLTLASEENDFTFTITDNGKGFDVDNIRQSEGFGLTQIRARVKNMNGTMTIKSKEGEGTNIIVKVQE